MAYFSIYCGLASIDVSQSCRGGSYKPDLVDRAGMPLGLTVDVEVRSPRNATAFETTDTDDAPASLSPGTSDVRYLLEANVRATQLVFQHNQRTLEAGLRMADTLREGIQTLADTQAWLDRGLARPAAARAGSDALRGFA
jgi:hypothetical protein